MNIPVLAVLDTNCNPDDVDYIIPGNDDAMRSIKLLVSTFADAVIEGKSMAKGDFEEDSEEEINIRDYSYDDDEDDEQFLGESTLAKLRDSKLFDEDEDEEDED